MCLRASVERGVVGKSVDPLVEAVELEGSAVRVRVKGGEGIELSRQMWGSAANFLHHIFSASLNAIDSACMEEREIVACLFDCQLFGPSGRVNT